MILTTLVALYERKAEQQEIAPYGWEKKAIPFIIQLHENGAFAALVDTRSDAKDAGKICVLPQSIGRSGKNSWQTAFLLWDHIGYALGLVTANEKAETVEKQHISFKQKLHNLPDDVKADKGVQAVIHFLTAADFSGITASEHWETLAKKKPNITFQLITRPTCIIANHDLVHKHVTQMAEHVDNKAVKGVCLVTGKNSSIARIHPKIKGVYGAQTAGASLVSFNDTAYTSFNKKQNYNAPISEYAAFAYTTALNYLLLKNSPHKLSIGKTTMVFWAENNPVIENTFGHTMSMDDNQANSPRNLDSMRNLFSAPHTGVKPILDDDTLFYILGLSPNASRLSVRFWHQAPVKEIAQKLLNYFYELELEMPPKWLAFPSLKQILCSMALQRKMENVPDQLAGAFIQAIFNGKAYPQSALYAALKQDHIESKSKLNTYPYRIALIKAILRRNYATNTQQELTMSLNEEVRDIGYRLGRLFYELENAQKQAHLPRKIKRTIRESYYASAASFPALTFPRLFSLYTHHLKKIKSKGQQSIAMAIDNKIAQIIEGIDAQTPYPTRLGLEQQGLFSVGYYHQRSYNKKAMAKKKQEKENKV